MKTSDVLLKSFDLCPECKMESLTWIHDDLDLFDLDLF